MKYRKPRHNPEKRANNYNAGDYSCPYCEYNIDKNGEKIYACEFPINGRQSIEKCKGNRHNCCKVLFKTLATLRDDKKEAYRLRNIKAEPSYLN